MFRIANKKLIIPMNIENKFVRI